MFGMMMDIGPKFDRVPSALLYIYDLKVRVTDLRVFMLKFKVKGFRASLFPNPVMYLIRYWSKMLQGTILLSRT